MQDELDVLVALRKEDGPLASCRRCPERLEQTVLAGDDAGAGEVAGAQAELVRPQRDAVHRDALAAEAAHDRETRVQQAEDDDRPHASASS